MILYKHHISIFFKFRQLHAYHELSLMEANQPSLSDFNLAVDSLAYCPSSDVHFYKIKKNSRTSCPHRATGTGRVTRRGWIAGDARATGAIGLSGNTACGLSHALCHP